MNVKLLIICMFLCGGDWARSADSTKVGVVADYEEDQALNNQIEFAILATSGKLEEALTSYEKLPSSVQTGAVFRLAYFDLLLEARKLDAAIALGIELKKDYPCTGRVLCAFGVQRIRSGDVKAGKKLLQQAINEDPWYARSYYELAKVSSNSEDIIALCSRGLLMAKENARLAERFRQILVGKQINDAQSEAVD